MLAQQTAAVITGGGGLQRRRGRALGFSAFGDWANVSGSASGTVDIAALQRALNESYSGSGTLLVVDGIMGPKTRARIAEFKSLLGYPATDTVDQVLLTALPSIGWNATSGAGGNGDQATAAEAALWAATFGLLGKPPTQIARANADGIKLGIEAAKALVKSTGNASAETVKAALQLLADNGDWIAKAAVALGVSYAVATAIVIGGAATVLIVFLKKK